MPLLLSRPFAAQLVIAIVLPIAFGLLAGYLLHHSETAYLVVSLVAVLGGVGAGFDHPGADEGFVRGVIGGLLFGLAILLGHSLFSGQAKADLPNPDGVLVVVTTILGAIFGAIGGGLRGRREARHAGAAAV